MHAFPANGSDQTRRLNPNYSHNPSITYVPSEKKVYCLRTKQIDVYLLIENRFFWDNDGWLKIEC